MFKNRLFALAAALGCAASLTLTVSAAEVESGAVYCFAQEDFGEVSGICLTTLPRPSVGQVMLGQRVLRPGDVLTTDQIAQITFAPVRTEFDRSAQVSYLPVGETGVGEETTVTIGIRGRENQVPVAEDSALETYKNLEVQGKLKVADPEGEAMTFAVTRDPRRGTVELGENGTFTYTPKKNKVGVDSFVYTATDPAGKVSREATVTITILKPTEAAQYRDTMGLDCRFAAEWMRNTGVFVGETVGSSSCFSPQESVTRGEFVSMLTRALDIPTEEEVVYTGYEDEIPAWLRPYVAAAVRAGLTAGLPDQRTFGAETPITGAEAAVMLENALDLGTSVGTRESGEVSDWASAALDILREAGIDLEADLPLTRGQTAMALYRANQIQREAKMS